MNLPSVTISAPQGRSGKTTISLGLCAVLRKRGLAVQPFKKGPDYIDPSWLTAACGRACRNLDPVLMSQDGMVAAFDRACRGVDLALIEGAMGLYDGFDEVGHASTARVARLLGSPVILVVNAQRMTRSVAAMVSGYKDFEPETNVAGVILNRVSGGRHQRKLTDAVERYCSLPVVGTVPNDPELTIIERHLGLPPFAEGEQAPAILEGIRTRLEPCLDVQAITSIARRGTFRCSIKTDSPQEKPQTVTIGVIRDRVFNFYYEENLEALRGAGARLVFIDSLVDRTLPDVDALYIGGGFPEFFLKELAANVALRQAISRAIEDYLPVYAECAGLMYLCRAIRNDGAWHEMVGVIPADVEVCSRPQGHGYVLAEVVGANRLFPAGLRLWGHEFHHSRLLNADSLSFAYRLHRGHGIDGHRDGIVYKNVLAAYTHLHSSGAPRWADALVSLARERRLVPAAGT